MKPPFESNASDITWLTHPWRRVVVSPLEGQIITVIVWHASVTQTFWLSSKWKRERAGQYRYQIADTINSKYRYQKGYRYRKISKGIDTGKRYLLFRLRWILLAWQLGRSGDDITPRCVRRHRSRKSFSFESVIPVKPRIMCGVKLKKKKDENQTFLFCFKCHKYWQLIAISKLCTDQYLRRSWTRFSLDSIWAITLQCDSWDMTS